MKKAINEVKIIFDSKSENESLARYIAASFCAAYNPTIDILADVKCTVSEAVTNCVVHAYKDTVGKIYMSLKAFDNNKVSICIRDRGCGIDDVETAKTPLFTTDPMGERSGMGFPIMESLSDKLRISSKKGLGTTVTMYFDLKKEVKR